MGFAMTAASLVRPLPQRATLIAAFEAPVYGAKRLVGAQLSAGARAWSKHVDRTPDGRWPEVCGSVAERNAKALELCIGVLDDVRWLNIHLLYTGTLVLEMRSSGGRGMRWLADGSLFIGFLEPHEYRA